MNISGPGFALPAYVGAPAGRGEGIACLAAVTGASLVGIDRSTQDGRDWTGMCLEWFNGKNGQGVALNGPSSGTGGSFWYEIFPGVLLTQLADLHPSRADLAGAVRTMADRWRGACEGLGGKDADFDWTGFDLAAGKPRFNGRWREPDAAAGIGWIEYAAWRRWGDPRHLEAACWCADFLERRKAEAGSPLYEVLLYYAPVLAARLNAEEGRRYDVDKLVQWCLSENRGPRGRPARAQGHGHLD